MDLAAVVAHVVPPGCSALFDPFHRRARVAAEGAGLGLSIVRSVADARGGEVAATARPEGGLVVVVSLPAG